MSDKAFKIGMFGGGGVGKTSIALRFLRDQFSEGYIPTIEDEFSKTIEVDDQTISLTIVDTAGQDDFTEMRYSYYGTVQAFVFVIDISQKQSIDEFRSIYKDASEAKNGEIYGVIAVNKADLRNENGVDLIPPDEYKKLESEFNCKVFETSAKTSLNVTELFNAVIRLLLKKDTQKAKSSEKNSGSKSKEDGGCCSIA